MTLPDFYNDFGYSYDSAYGANQEKAEWVLKKWLQKVHNMRTPGAARMNAGTCIQGGTDLILGTDNYNDLIGQQEGMPIAEATRHTMSRYDEYKPRTWEEKDAEEHEAFREHIPEMIANAVAAVKEWSAKANLLEGEHQSWHKVDGLDVSIMYYRDYHAGGEFADLKCQLPLRNPPKKDGTRSWRIPKPQTTPSWNQTVQMAVYWKASGQSPSLLYVTASGYHIANSQNCEALTDESLERAYNHAVRCWKTTQNLVRAARGNWHTLAGLVQPDFNEIARRHGPNILELARQLWRD